MKAVLKLNEELKIFAKILVDFRHLFFFSQRGQCVTYQQVALTVQSDLSLIKNL